jgi:hypothetical protein
MIRVRICPSRLPVPQRLSQIAVLRIRHPDPREALSDHDPQQQLRVLAIGLPLAHPLGADLGGVPIHSSNCNPPSKHSNRSACPLASMPTALQSQEAQVTDCSRLACEICRHQGLGTSKAVSPQRSHRTGRRILFRRGLGAGLNGAMSVSLCRHGSSHSSGLSQKLSDMPRDAEITSCQLALRS